MTLEELEEALAELIPGFSLEYDDDGQIIIFTNLTEGEDGELTDMDDSDDSMFDDDTEQLEDEENFED